MGYIRKWWSRQKWKETLVFQLGVSILVVNMLVLIICFVFQYTRVGNILLEKDERDIVDRFEQSEHNINIFVEQVDIASRRLAVDSNLQKLSNGKEMSRPDQVSYANQVLKSMEELQYQYNYPYLEFISYYGKDGLIIKSVKELRNSTYFVWDEMKEDPFYSSEIYQSVNKNKLKLKWFSGHSMNDFGVVATKEKTEKYYVSAIRSVMSGRGVLVINVDVDYFLDIFSAENKGNSEKLYIIDENNKIVASKNEKEIGTDRLFGEGEELYNGIYKYIEDGDQGKSQVIVYSISSMNWKMVSEMPIAEVVRERNDLRDILIVSCLFSVIVSFILSVQWVSKMLKPLKKLDQEMQKVGEGYFGVIPEPLPKNELGAVTRRFNHMSGELQTLFWTNQNIEKEKRQLEMQALRGQINPHLIYNVLNNIKWRAIFSNERNIAESVSLLAEFLQPIFKNQDIMCTVEEELVYVKNYIAIMNLLRTGGYILELDVPEEYYHYQMIRFLLQPVVENSILHGHSQEISGKIRISMRKEGTDAIILVEDDGEGIEETRLQEVQEKLARNEPLQTQGIGIVNVNRRIRNQYGEKYGLTICNSAEKGTLVTLKIRLE